MFFSQLLMLNNSFSDGILSAVDDYLSGLSPSAQKLITVSKLSDATHIDYPIAAELIRRCLEIGLLKKGFGLRCPECGMLLSEVGYLQELLCNIPYCSVCEKTIDLDEINCRDNIVLLFSINSTVSPFQTGQQGRLPALNATGGIVVPVDSLDIGVQYQLVTYDDLFFFQEKACEKLRKLLEQVERKHANTTEQGASLEIFICQLLSQCILFCATTGHRSQTNQIDIMVRVRGIVNSCLFSRLGNSFYVECKNENDTPSIDYLQKFRGILHDAGMQFGIFVSREKEPHTYKENTNHIFLKDDLVIVRFCLQELKQLIDNKENLLECLDRKITEVTTNASYSLGQNGLKIFDA